MELSINRQQRTIRAVATLSDLRKMDAFDLVIWATPNQQGDPAQLYVARQKSWAEDYGVAQLSDFLAAAGWDWLDDDAEEDDPVERITLVIPFDDAVNEA